MKAERPLAAEPRRDRARVRRRHRRGQARPPGRAALGRAAARARLRAHEARRRQAGAQARPPARHPDGRDARQPLPEPARAGARAVRVGQGLDARRDRRRRARPRRRRHHARDQLRPAAGRGRLRAPHRPHRPRRPLPATPSRSSCPTSRPRSASSPSASGTATRSAHPGCASPSRADSRAATAAVRARVARDRGVAVARPTRSAAAPSPRHDLRAGPEGLPPAPFGVARPLARRICATMHMRVDLARTPPRL